MSSADTATDAPDAAAAEGEPAEEAPRDERREELVARLRTELGDALAGEHIRPGDDVWVRVDRRAWREAMIVAREQLVCSFFDFLSGLDWLPSPFGRDMDSQEDIAVHGKPDKEPVPMTTGYAGGDTRFQVFARVYAPTRQLGITLKADLPDDDLSIDSIADLYAGANWHERECTEMFGFAFVGHPNPTKLYLPADFEGYPLRKDFPLLSRRLKPWPGIVDVEPLPGEGDEDEGDGSGEGGDA